MSRASKVPKPLTWSECVQRSLHAKGTKEHDCKISVFLSNIIKGEDTWQAYTAAISNCEITLYCDKGILSYVVDTYGDTHRTELIDWEKSE